MKKLLVLLVAMIVLMTSGCQRVSTLLVQSKKQSDETTVVVQEPKKTEDVEKVVGDDEQLNKIPLSSQISVTNAWQILGDYRTELTTEGTTDRVILATSAKAKNGEMQWDDAQYWTVAVVLDDHDGDGNMDGAYNLFTTPDRIPGRVYVEVNQAYYSGVATPIITVYIFSGTDRQIRNYVFDGEFFVEKIEYTTKNFSTAGINNLYSNFPEYEPM